MSTAATPLEKAVSYLMEDQPVRPEPPEIVDALVVAEKQSKRAKQAFRYEQLLGTWRLGFVSGTRKVSPSGPGKTPIKQPGKGRFLPKWIEVTITYGEPAELLEPELLPAKTADTQVETQILGAVANRVRWAGLQIQLSGPTRYWPTSNILSFDFVHLRAEVSGLRLYNKPVRGGIKQAQTFASQPLREQAFFSFFEVTPTHLAARGKGGGLALWTRR